jgi:glycosyltransferase involved in cell wall biosynthesis
VVCSHIGDQLREQGVDAERIFDVRNAVDVSRFHPDVVPTPLADRFRERIGVSGGSDTLTLGFVGGLQPYKGLADLATALERTSGDWHLLVAGDGPAHESLKGRLGQRATFLGSVPYEQVPALYHEFDAFVLPSHTEGLPRVILEAQATATPVIATRVGGVPEVIDDGKTGVLCEPHAPTELAAALDRLATNEDERTRLAEQGRAAVATDYSWPTLYERYERYLQQVVR